MTLQDAPLCIRACVARLWQGRVRYVARGGGCWANGTNEAISCIRGTGCVAHRQRHATGVQGHRTRDSNGSRCSGFEIRPGGRPGHVLEVAH